jgi:BASS family bile acid:Na+ symporter
LSRSLAILAAIGVGIFVQSAQQYTFIIQYSLMVMLFFAFLQVQLSTKALHRHHLWVLLINIALPVSLFYLIESINLTMALAVFTVASTPTAAAAPVMAGFLKKEVGYVTISVLITSPVIALILPITLATVLEDSTESVNAWHIATPVISLIFIPLVLSVLLRWIWKKGALQLQKYAGIAFYLFLINVFIAAAKASAFMTSQADGAWGVISSIAFAIALLCLFQFRFGEWIGRKHLSVETGLALGRKNTMFGIWLALTFISPIAALGPMFYILFQNLYNAWQLYRMENNSSSH